jgi:phenylalanyl-tRNA synthetase beta chain
MGVVGELHPEAAKDFTTRERVIVAELALDPLMHAFKSAPQFQPLSPFPAVTRDLAPRVASEIPYADVELAVRSAECATLERVTLTDVFAGPPLPEGIKSLTLSLTFRSTERTLTDEEVNAAQAQIRRSLESSCGATFVG